MTQDRAAKQNRQLSAQPAKPAPTVQSPSVEAVLLQSALADPATASPKQMLRLQGLAGNRAVSRLIQTKLTVGPAGDKYEQEADRVADQVTRADSTPPPVQRTGALKEEDEEGAVQLKPLAPNVTTPLAASISRLVQRQETLEEDDDDDDDELQTKRAGSGAGFELDGQLENRLRASRGSGDALPADTRSQMESRFGTGFGNVRIHTGGEAADLNRQINAQAFTHGPDVFFGAGKYNPQTFSGKRLLAHELTHVVQQGAAAAKSVQRQEDEGDPQPQISGPTDVRMGGVGVTSLDDVRERMGHMGYDPKKVMPAGGPMKGSVKRGKEATGAENITADIQATEKQQKDPIGALKVFREQAANYVRQTIRHKFKIERYTRFFEADFRFVLQKSQHVKQLKETIKQTKDKKQEKLLQKELDKDQKSLGQDPEQALPEASNRVAEAQQAGSVVDTEGPLVDYAYDEIKRMRHAVQAEDTRGWFSNDPHERLEHYSAEQDKTNRVDKIFKGQGRETSKKFQKQKAKIDKNTAKHSQRVALHAKAAEMVTQAGRLLGQAKLSESHLAVRRKRLKQYKAKIKGKHKRGVTTTTHLGNTVKTGIASALTSMATLGFVELEQEASEGGYTSERRTVLGWNTWKKEIAKLKQVIKAKPYGKVFTWVHVILQGFGGLVLKPLRNLFGGIALASTLLSFIPGAAVIFGPIAAVSAVIAAGLALAKVAVDAILATWSALALLFNKNPRSTDILRAQVTSQATDALTGGVSVATTMAAPALGNLAGGQYKNPLELATSGESITKWSTGGAGGDLTKSLSSSAALGGYALHQAAVQGAKGGAQIGELGINKGVGAVRETEGFGPGAAALFQRGRQMEDELHAPLGDRSKRGKSTTPKTQEDQPSWMTEGAQQESGVRLEAKSGTARKAAGQLKALHNRIGTFVDKSGEVEENSQKLSTEVENAKSQPGVKEKLQPADSENSEGVKSGSSEGREALESFSEALSQATQVAEKAEKGKDPDLA